MDGASYVMKHRIRNVSILLVLLVFGLLYAYLVIDSFSQFGFRGYHPDRLPRDLTEGRLSRMSLRPLARIWGFIGHDYSDKSFLNLSLPFLAMQAFDEQTKWPGSDSLPEGFVPEVWLETGKNPGLGVRRLTEKGITGKGVSVAVIDKPLRFSHSEFETRMTYHEVFGNDQEGLGYHFHGLACASILAGSSTGVAPEAHVYYFAVPDNGKNFMNYSLAVDQLVAVNRTLEKTDKIRIVSISDGEPGQYLGQWENAMRKLEAEGIEVVYSDPHILSSVTWGGCPPYLDRENPSNYGVNPDMGPMENVIIIPGDYRTTASNTGDTQYVYWGEGGMSWAIPYMAGLSALAWQVNPELSYSQIEELFREAAFVKPDGVRVIMPQAFMEKVTLLATTSLDVGDK